MLAVLAAAATHRGAVRDHNEDAFVVGSLVSAGETSSPVEVLLRLDRPADAAIRAWFRANPQVGGRDRRGG